MSLIRESDPKSFKKDSKIEPKWSPKPSKMWWKSDQENEWWREAQWRYGMEKDVSSYAPAGLDVLDVRCIWIWGWGRSGGGCRAPKKIRAKMEPKWVKTSFFSVSFFASIFGLFLDAKMVPKWSQNRPKIMRISIKNPSAFSVTFFIDFWMIFGARTPRKTIELHERGSKNH